MGKLVTVLEVGGVYGNWTVIGEPRKDNSGRYRIIPCRCQWGRECLVHKNNLKYGGSTCCVKCKSLVSKPHSDLVGKKFGDWNVVSPDPSAQRYRKYNCVCDCGNSRILLGSILRHGREPSCPVCKDSRRQDNIYKRIWYTILKGARDRNLEVTITMEDALELLKKQNNKCALSGLHIVIATCDVNHRKGLTTASLDRIDSTKGYTLQNCQWCHKKLNILKMAMPNDEFISWCKAVAKHNSKIKGHPITRTPSKMKKTFTIITPL